eukprot:365357-Chlamydomonas_euryale.AAC.3
MDAAAECVRWRGECICGLCLRVACGRVGLASSASSASSTWQTGAALHGVAAGFEGWLES